MPNQLSGAPLAPEQPDLDGIPSAIKKPRRRAPAKKPFALDLETIPHREYWHGADYEIDRYWEEKHLDLDCSVESINSDRADARLKGEAPMQLTGQLPSCHPTTAHIVACSTARLDEDGNIQIDTAQIDEHVSFNGDPGCSIESVSTNDLLRAESRIVKRAFQLLEWAIQNGLTVVTFNGKPFDLPMLRWRAMLLGVEIPKFNWFELLYPYRHKEHIDLRLLLSDGDKRARGTLAMWCKAFGIEAEEHGAEVFDWCLRGQWSDLRKYGGDDVVSTIKLFQEIEGAL